MLTLIDTSYMNKNPPLSSVLEQYNDQDSRDFILLLSLHTIFIPFGDE